MSPGGVYVVALPAAHSDGANLQPASRFRLNNTQFQSSFPETFADGLGLLWDWNAAVV